MQVTLTTYDEDLCKIIEPNVCTTKERAEVLNILRENGIVCNVDDCFKYLHDLPEKYKQLELF